MFEEGGDGGPAVAMPHPQDAGSLGIRDHGGIAMSLVQGALIHHQPPYLPEFDGAHSGLQTALVDLFDCVPTDPVSWLTWRMGGLNERFKPALHAPGKVGASEQPIDMFADAATAQTVDAPNGQL